MMNNIITTVFYILFFPLIVHAGWKTEVHYFLDNENYELAAKMLPLLCKQKLLDKTVEKTKWRHRQHQLIEIIRWNKESLQALLDGPIACNNSVTSLIVAPFSESTLEVTDSTSPNSSLMSLTKSLPVSFCELNLAKDDPSSATESLTRSLHTSFGELKRTLRDLRSKVKQPHHADLSVSPSSSTAELTSTQTDLSDSSPVLPWRRLHTETKVLKWTVQSPNFQSPYTGRKKADQ